MQLSALILLTTTIALCAVIGANSKSLNTHMSRHRRAAADQRLAELQALVALSSSGGSKVGHGLDIFAAGKRSGYNPDYAYEPYEYDVRQEDYSELDDVLDRITPQQLLKLKQKLDDRIRLHNTH